MCLFMLKSIFVHPNSKQTECFQLCYCNNIQEIVILLDVPMTKNATRLAAEFIQNQ